MRKWIPFIGIPLWHRIAIWAKLLCNVDNIYFTFVCSQALQVYCICIIKCTYLIPDISRESKCGSFAELGAHGLLSRVLLMLLWSVYISALWAAAQEFCSDLSPSFKCPSVCLLYCTSLPLIGWGLLTTWPIMSMNVLLVCMGQMSSKGIVYQKWKFQTTYIYFSAFGLIQNSKSNNSKL